MELCNNISFSNFRFYDTVLSGYFVLVTHLCPFILFLHSTYSPGIYNVLGQMLVGRDRTFAPNTRQVYKEESSWICCQQKAGTPPETVNDNTLTRDIHLAPELILKSLTTLGIEPEMPAWNAGILPTIPKEMIRIIFEILRVLFEV